MAERIDIAIIGGGVIGCATAWALSARRKEVYLFERNPGITQGENQSSRNSGVIHSGIYYDQQTRPLKAALCVEGNRLLYDFCERHRVPALKTGKLIVAKDSREEGVLDAYLSRGRENGVPGLKRISGKEAGELEPNVRCRSALLVPTAGIVDPSGLVYRLHTLGLKNGVQYLTGTEAVGVEDAGDALLLTIRYPDGKQDQVRAGVAVNAAGIDADLLTRLLDPLSPYELDPVRGESYCFYSGKRPDLNLRGMNVYPTPEVVETPHGRHFTVGIHLTPTFESTAYPPRLGSTVTVGPKLVPASHREDRSGPACPPEVFSEKVRPFFPGLKAQDLVWHQAGLQARLKGYGDFFIAPNPKQPRFIQLLGLDSPGLTSCLAVARQAKKLVEEIL